MRTLREIKFRAWDNKNDKMIYFDNFGLCLEAGYGYSNPTAILNAKAFYDHHGFELSITDLEIMQFTGLYDSTKWEQLSKAEKKAFYNKNCSKDGRTIMYQNVEDVRHLWKGREIYEGDILIDSGEYYSLVLWSEDYAGWFIQTCDGPEPLHEQGNVVICGNIHDNFTMLCS